MDIEELIFEYRNAASQDANDWFKAIMEAIQARERMAFEAGEKGMEPCYLTFEEYLKSDDYKREPSRE